MNAPLNRQILAFSVLLVLIVSSVGIALFMNPSQNEDSGKDLYLAGMREFENSNYNAASDLFNRSYQAYKSAGEQELARQSLEWKFRADRILLEYCLNREQAEVLLAEVYHWVPSEVRSSWLDDERVERIVSDGGERFFYGIAENLAFRNLTLYHELHDGRGTDIYAAVMKEIIEADAKREDKTYFNQTRFIANGALAIPRGALPATGTLSIWIPVPIETASQEITGYPMVTIQDMRWVKAMSLPTADIGYVYLEVPLDGLQEDVTVSVSYSFTAYQMHFDIDPSAVGEYDRSSPEYLKYTASHGNILVTEDVMEEARAVVGDETDPYVQAKLLYDYVIGNISYSYTPHTSLEALGIAESEYVRENRRGDCGAQSMYYCALLRSLGIPARSTGGYQMLGGGTGTHFWAEFYLPNYGWVPVDVTGAEGMDWIWLDSVTPEERERYKEYYFGNLDNCRYVIQKDVDESLWPEPDTFPLLSLAFQYPMASCTTSDLDMPVVALDYWEFVITPDAPKP
ncbi:MAG TPA: transglutaminase-like domain-containing protein [Methanomassiliicoccaceae archaeon]|nr:transglutaminase-like domain-containing protein [Methanomassiliicoccaceae archaeon]